ncbi:alpha-ketoglutarate-dependent dioxygenase AlkB [Zobellella sp. DQSA1]|uniref:alpha-ketoglutarate-dependent dioxygenase AlkB family protein n=1 Tax=Zobellella sp. DQSA1 TaxID=3342386 RepID=UPI0035C005B0
MDLWGSRPEWIELAQGRLLWWPDVFAVEADAWLLQLQREIPWQQHRLRLFGRELDEPRLSCWMGEAAYRYSGRSRQPLPWHPLITEIRRRLEALCEQPFNGVLLNLYRDGRDSMGWHADDEPELGADPVIASLSLGATRRFTLRHRQGERRQLLLNHGSLLVMAGEMQHHWQHALPKAAGVTEARINLTFRYLPPEGR